MSNQDMWLAALEEAGERLHQATKDRPEGFDVYAWDFGSSDTSQDTSFARRGTSTQVRSREIPSFLSSLIQQNLNNTSVPDSLAGSQDNFLSGLLSRDATIPPGNDTLQSSINFNPTGFTGTTTLTNLANRDPLSGSYEANTAQKYTDTVNNAISTAGTGPANVRGGQARAAYREGDAINRVALERTDEVRRAQAQDSSIAMQASQILQAIEGGRRALLMQGQDQWVKQFLGMGALGTEASKSIDGRRGVNAGLIQVGSTALGTEQSKVTDNLSGKGNQTGDTNHSGSSFSCCFIMLEAFNGVLPVEIRRGRDEITNSVVRKGYIRMAKWLVPWMQRSRIVRHLTNYTMAKPFLVYGVSFYKPVKTLLDRTKLFFTWLVVKAWLTIWSITGKETK